MYKIFENQAVDGESIEVVITEADDAYIHVSGDLGGGTVTLECEIDGNYALMDGATFTEPLMKVFDRVPASSKVKAILTGSTGADVNVIITS